MTIILKKIQFLIVNFYLGENLFMSTNNQIHNTNLKNNQSIDTIWNVIKNSSKND